MRALVVGIVVVYVVIGIIIIIMIVIVTLMEMIGVMVMVCHVVGFGVVVVVVVCAVGTTTLDGGCGSILAGGRPSGGPLGAIGFNKINGSLVALEEVLATHLLGKACHAEPRCHLLVHLHKANLDPFRVV